jgi:hypothetical protein
MGLPRCREHSGELFVEDDYKLLCVTIVIFGLENALRPKVLLWFQNTAVQAKPIEPG